MNFWWWSGLKRLEREPSRLAAAGDEEDFENQVRAPVLERAADGDRPRSGQIIPSPNFRRAATLFCFAANSINFRPCGNCAILFSR
jgi:hypothetical protein